MPDDIPESLRPVQRIFSEVISKGGQACLPCNLSDFWIDHLSQQLSELVSGATANPNIFAGDAILLVMAILAERGDLSGDEAVEDAVLVACLHELRLELALEALSRLLKRPVQPATIDTLFRASLASNTPSSQHKDADALRG
ncbi:hypothetical protein [Geopseudomonas aromaticivorans]